MDRSFRPRTGLAVGHGPVDRPDRPLELRTFAVPEDQLTAARSWVAYGERRPRAARRASSVAVVRDGLHGVETLLRHRGGTTPLGTLAFPGGSLEDFDEEPCTWYGPTPAQWARVLGVNDHRLARRHLMGAIRELFEETGILLAGRDAFSVAEDPGGAEWGEVRQALDRQEITLSEVLRRRGFGVRTDLLRAVGQWHSPDFAHRRFITHYFAAAAPRGQSDSLLPQKGTWARWRPAGMLLAGLEDTRLGDAVGRPETVGRPFARLTVPAVPLLLERMAAAGSTVRFMMDLTIRGAVPEHRVELLDRVDGRTPDPDRDPAPGVSGIHDDDLRLGVRLPGGRWS